MYKIGSDFDLQRAYGFEVKGLNKIHFNIKGKNAWTTLQPNIGGLCMVDINLGPGTCKWIMISISEKDKLELCVNAEMKNGERFDMKHPYYNAYFSEEILKKHEIRYEVHVQESNSIIFIPSGTMYQILSSNDNISINYYVLPFNFNVILYCIESYTFHRDVIQWPSPVPLPRILHTLILTERNRFSIDELIILSQHLLKIVNETDKVHNDNISNSKFDTDFIRTTDIIMLENNNCEICTRPLFMRYFCLYRPGSKTRICVFCFCPPHLNFVQFVEEKIHIRNLGPYIEKMLDCKFSDCSNYDPQIDWEFKPLRLPVLNRLDFKDSNEKILISLRLNTKTAHIRKQIEAKKSY